MKRPIVNIRPANYSANFNISHLGLHQQPARVVAPAPRAKENLGPERVTNVMLLISSLLNVEEAGNYLKTTPRFSGVLQDDLRRLTKLGKEINLRFLAEFSEADSKQVDTMNKASNMLKQLCLMMLSLPEDVADAAANAAADVAQKYMASTFKS